MAVRRAVRAAPALPPQAMSAASEPVVLIECPHCWHVIQRTVRDLKSTPGFWCETCANWAANSEVRIVEVRMSGNTTPKR